MDIGINVSEASVTLKKMEMYRNSEYNRTNFFQRYVNMCSYKMLSTGIPRNSKIITSDDIFDFLLDIRNLNQGIDNRREDLFVEYGDIATSGMSLRSMDDYDDYKKYMETRRLSKSQYVKKWLKPNVQMRSNGESAMDFFMKQIDRNALYLLDEPENSLSPKFQLTLKEFLEDSVVGFNCQFIIATHSPILLSMKNAKIYDLDSISPSPKKWTELENVRTYFELFDKRREEFLDI